MVAISSRRAEHRDWLGSRIRDALSVESGQTAANLANVVFVTGPDSAIEEICDGIEWRAHQAVIHCSGVLPVSILHAASEQGAITAGFHPLQTFPSPGSSDRLKDVSFAIES